MLPQYLDHDSVLNARLVCKTWSKVFNAEVQKVHVSLPGSAAAAKAVGRQAAAFANATLLAVDAKHGSCAETLVALLRPLRQLHSLQELRLRYFGTRLPRCLHAALPLLPQLRVLDLSQCFHSSCDLLIVAQHLKQLQQLLLHCPEFTTLSGRVVGRPSYGWHWEYVGGILPYQPQHVAALAQLPRLRVLECAVPTVCTAEHQVQCEFGWTGSAMQLVDLHAAANTLTIVG